MSKDFMFDPTTLNGHVHQLGDPRIFVFGSNTAGIHGGGAAWYASKKLGAVWGVGEGLTGQTYALPTCYKPGEPVTFGELMVYVQNFLDFAAVHPELQFFVSAVGCGIAGFHETEVGPLFKDATTNCDLPPGWREKVCQRIVEFNPMVECGKSPTHLYRYNYELSPLVGEAVRGRIFGGTCLCDEHFGDSADLSRLNNDVDPPWVKL
jgi:hypothetical protein